MTAFAVSVNFDIADANRAEFEQLVRRNAAMSLAHEPGCRRFDVLVPVGGDDRSLSLYEVYDDPKAFDAHTATAHFRCVRRRRERHGSREVCPHLRASLMNR